MKYGTTKHKEGLQLTLDGEPQFATIEYACGNKEVVPMLVDSKKVVDLANKAQNEEYPHEVKNFKYNGFIGKEEKGKAPYKAKFKSWSGDPGVAIMNCSDGKERLIPTFAISFPFMLPKDEIPMEKRLFGNSSKS